MTPCWRESNWFGGKKEKSSKKSTWFGEPRYKLGSNSRIQFASNENKLVPKNLDYGTPSKVGLIMHIQEWKALKEFPRAPYIHEYPS